MQAAASTTGSTVEIVPQSKRDSLFASATYKLNDNLKAFAEVALSRYDLTARIAANPVPISIAKGSAAVQHLRIARPDANAGRQRASSPPTTALVDWGLRASQTITDTKHLVLGVEGELRRVELRQWPDLVAKLDRRALRGRLCQERSDFKDMLTNPDFDPFALPGQQTPSSAATDRLTRNSTAPIRTASTTMRGVDTHGSREVFSLPGGKASLGIGGDYRTYTL